MKSGKRLFFPVLCLMATSTAWADDCTVTGDAVVCRPNGSYNPADHGGKALQDYASVTLETTDANRHGYAQYAYAFQFKDVSVKTSGASADGIRLMNWGPMVSFENLTVTTTGFSADGINLGRDNTDGRVTVNKKTVIEAALGMGARASSAGPGYGPGAHIITFNGSSEIRTRGAGSFNGGHAVYAGVDNSCGAGLFQCKSEGAAEVRLLGGANDLHKISTNGDGSNAVYAAGRGLVKAGNLDIETSGAEAHGIVAQRISGLYYNGLADIRPQDYAGNVELTGNVSVKTSGNDAYAVYADSFSASSGKDSLGATASIRSYDSATGLPVSNKIYRITGNMLATNSGIIDLRMGNASRFTGNANATNNGILNLAIAGDSSAWNMTDNSSLGTLRLTSGATLALSNAAPTNALTLRGNVFNQGGIIDLAGTRGSTGNSLTIVGNYVGQRGTVVLRTTLGGDNSLTDRLILDGGSATGDTGLRIINTGGVGAQTKLGIRVVETINGATTTANAFRLDAESTGYRASTGTLAVGGYEYSLVRGHSGVESDWFLASQATLQPPITPPKPPVTPPEPPPPVVPSKRNVSPESGAYVANQLAGMTLFSHSLHDRQAVPRNAEEMGRGAGLWTRVEGREDKRLSMKEGQVEINRDSYVMQLGGELLHAAAGRDGAVYVGLMAGYGNSRGDSISTLMRAGSGSAQAKANGKTSGYAGGLYATIYANDATRMGAYADTWVQYGRFDNRISSDLGTARYTSRVWSASLEGGYAIRPFASDDTLANLVVEPHAQVIHSRYSANDTSLQGTRMRSGKNGATLVRTGVRLYAKPASDAAPAALRPFVEANWLHRDTAPSVRMDDNALGANGSRNAFEFKLGMDALVAKRTQVSAQVLGQFGGGERGYGGMLKVSHRW